MSRANARRPGVRAAIGIKMRGAKCAAHPDLKLTALSPHLKPPL
ncbi:hypothetical protein BN2475_340114 [Paraburkholderia ribeironis]|uniref:Uncharacterized protein n=1 Tax=Paraburkholderia ribeironis TaxID=1247936 RepID=A0A1N7S449_9BURK|nr:hypothetical protein BN2475_340114 [Paraburkholderia ribeironis]